MTQASHTVLRDFPVRKTKQQKARFREWLCGELEKLGYAPTVEAKGISTNVVAGDPERAELLFTAHYDTCAALPVPNFITPRNMGWYLLYQIAITIAVIALGVVAEIGVVALWEKELGTDCPMLLAMCSMYVVCGALVWCMLAGPANRHNVNDNTSGVLTLLEIATALPAERRDRVCLVFFDNEEKGLLGSGAFAKRHPRAREKALVVNFDCVSDGHSVQFFPSKGVKALEEVLTALEQSYLPAGEKTVEVVRTFGFYPSDQAKFHFGVGVCALKESRFFGFYMDRIHTRRDTVLMEENIHLLRDGSVRLAEELFPVSCPEEAVT